MTNEAYAELLRTAAASGKTIPPLRERGLSEVSDAYAIQQINIAERIKNGARVVGKKIGLTSFAVQKQLGVDQPDFGVLLNDMEILNGQSISADKILQPKAEAEVAFVLGEDLDVPDLTIVDLISCVDYVLPSIEIVGSRIQNWDIKFLDTVADNASASHFVLGHTPKTLDEVDIVNCKMHMTKNGEVVSEGSGAACLGSPLNALLWLASKMMEFGTPLEAGDLILSGAVGPMTGVVAGDQVEAVIEGLGSVRVGFD